MDNIILYSTHCPRCDVLTKKMNEREIPFTENNDVDYMVSIGITEVPVLSVNGKLMQFVEANQWVNDHGGASV